MRYYLLKVIVRNKHECRVEKGQQSVVLVVLFMGRLISLLGYCMEWVSFLAQILVGDSALYKKIFRKKLCVVRGRGVFN